VHNVAMHDVLIRGIALNGRARVVAASTTRAVQELRRIHDPSPEVAAAVGRMATGALILASSLEKVTRKEPVLTAEIQGGGPAGKIVATASPAGWVRAFAADPRATAPRRSDGKLNVAGVVGDQGQLIVTRDPGFGEPFRGVVPIFSGEIAKDFALYLTESEQTPSAVALGVFTKPDVGVSHAGGLLVQLLPGVTENEAHVIEQRIAEMGAITTLMRTGRGPVHWITDLFAGEAEILESTPVEFRCGCSESKVEAAVKLLGAAEVESMLIASRNRAEIVTCEFCKKRYELEMPRLRRLHDEILAETQSN